MSLITLCCTDIHGQTIKVDGVTYGYVSSGWGEYFSVLDYDGSSKIVIIKDSIVYDSKKYPVLKIGERAFQRKELQKVVIPPTLKNFNRDSFQLAHVDSLIIQKATNLISWFSYASYNTNQGTFKYIYLGRTPDEMDSSTRDYISVGTMDIENNIREFDTYCYPNHIGTVNLLPGTEPLDLKYYSKYSKIKELKINRPLNITSISKIPANNFLESLCLLENVYEIPYGLLAIFSNQIHLRLLNRVTNFDWTMLRKYNISSLELESDIPGYYYDRDNGMLFDEDKTILYYVSLPHKQCHDHLIIPRSVTEIADCACQNTPINTFEAPELRKVGNHAFDGSHLKQLITNKPIEYIGAYGFASCDFSDISIVNNLEALPNGIFYNCCELTSLNFNKNLKSIGDSAFNECLNLTEVNFNDKLETIGSRAFENCIKIKELTLNENIRSIGQYAFSTNIALESVNWDTAIDSISTGMFSYCFKLDMPQIPENITAIGDRAFYQCLKITNLKLDNNITTVGSEAFARCNLTDIYIGDNVKSLGAKAFALNPDLKTINYDAGTPVAAADNLFSDYETPTLRIPEGCLNKFSNVSPWNKFKSIQPDAALSRIEAIEVDDSELPILYYDLNGRLIDNPGPGIYIKKQGNKVEKVIKQ